MSGTDGLPLVIAGAGYVGLALARITDRHTIGIRRNPTDEPAVDTWIAADLTRDELQLEGDRYDVVYLPSPDGPSEEAYERAYGLGLERLLAALAGRVRRLVVVTSTGVYGQDDGSWVDEDSPTEPSRASAAWLLRAEERVRDMPQAISLRLGGIYGPGRDRLVRRVREGTAIVGAEERFQNRIHRDDCAGAIAHLLSLDVPHPVYVGVDEEPADLRVVQRWLCAELGVDESSLAPAPSSPAGAGKRCSSQRLRNSGYTFRYPTFREGYRGLL